VQKGDLDDEALAARLSLLGVPALIAGFFETHAGQTPQHLTLSQMLDRNAPADTAELGSTRLVKSLP
jgi:hypothetical protein